MKFSVNQQDIQKSLNYCQGVIEKRSTLPILSNVLLDASNSKLKLTATDLDVIFIHEIENVEIQEEGKTTTSSSIMYDIIRKISSGRKINFSNINDSKLNLESENSVFNLNCISSNEFPVTDEDFNEKEFEINSKGLLKLLNKCKFSISSDETRHYLSGIFLHITSINNSSYLTAAATDSHRMSISKLRLKDEVKIESLILPKKTIFQLCSLLEDNNGDVKVSTTKSIKDKVISPSEKESINELVNENQISQIDLARTYLESGDKAKAEEIIIAVINTGEETEKHEARLLYMQLRK